MHGILFSNLRSFLSPRTSIGFHEKTTEDNQVLVFKKDYFYRNFLHGKSKLTNATYC